MDVIKEGSFVVIKAANIARLVRVDPKKPVFFGKRKFNVDNCIGQAYGSTFEIKGHGLCKISADEYRKQCCQYSLESDETRSSGQDNRNLLDDGKSQKLTRDQIEGFKADGTSGESIIRTLVEHSTTFGEKTEYAQQKYLKKKQQKYLQYVTLERPTGRVLAEMYYAQNPLKLGNMRADALAQLLTACNVSCGGRYVVFDSWLGLVTAAVLERLGRRGSVVQVYAGQGPESSYRQAVQALDLDEDSLRSLLHELPFSRAHDLLRDDVDVSIAEDTAPSSPNRTEHPMEAAENGAVADEDVETTKGAEERSSGSRNSKDEERSLRKMRRLEEQERATQLLKTRSLDGLLVASRSHPTRITLTLLEFVAPSRPFAVFSTYREPLVDCYSALKDAGNAVFLKLSETWLRTYQVLPNRTHPAINMSGGGGYVLTGIKVSADAR